MQPASTNLLTFIAFNTPFNKFIIKNQCKILKK